MHIRFSQALLKVRRSRACSDVQRSFSWREIIFPSRKRTAISRRPAWTQEEPWRRAPIWSPCWSRKINVYPRRVRRAKLDLQVGNHPALYLVIAKKIVTVQSLYLLVFIFMKTRSLVVPPYADLDEKVLMQASLQHTFSFKPAHGWTVTEIVCESYDGLTSVVREWNFELC